MSQNYLILCLSLYTLTRSQKNYRQNYFFNFLKFFIFCLSYLFYPFSFSHIYAPFWLIYASYSLTYRYLILKCLLFLLFFLNFPNFRIPQLIPYHNFSVNLFSPLPNDLSKGRRHQLLQINLINLLVISVLNSSPQILHLTVAFPNFLYLLKLQFDVYTLCSVTNRAVKFLGKFEDCSFHLFFRSFSFTHYNFLK